MKKLISITIGFFFISTFVPAQSTIFVKGKGYEGYIFSQEHLIWGLKGRYTPSEEDIVHAEKILKDSIGTDYIKSNQLSYKKPPINKRTLNKYVRQYVGYLTDENEIIISINFLHKKYCKEFENETSLSEDIISICDGGFYFWKIKINITMKQLFDMYVNGIA